MSRRPPPDSSAPASPDLSRREFLRAGAAVAAGLLAGCAADGQAPAGGDGAPGPATDGGTAEDLAPPADLYVAIDPPEQTPEVAAFPLGVSAGDALPDAAVVWTRYTGKAPLELAVYRVDGARYAAALPPVAAMPDAAGFVHVEARGLEAGARYRYAFFEIEAGRRRGRSPIGRLRAAIAPDAEEPLLLGACSCTKNGRGFDTIERAALRDDLDAFLLLGDTTYNDGAKSIADYRGKWAENLGTAGYRALRAMTPVIATWDDHEIDNNFNPESIDKNQFAAARQAFFEHLPVRRDPNVPDRIWRRFTWGKTADLFVLDSRGERLPSTRKTADSIYLSRVQMNWLRLGLAGSQARFKIILNSVPIGDFGLIFGLGDDDRWTGYKSQREEILGHIDQYRIGGVLWLSGDFHFGSVGFLDKDGVGSGQREVLAGPGAQIANPLVAAADALKQIEWTTASNNYVTLGLDPKTGKARVVFYDGKGAALTDRTLQL